MDNSSEPQRRQLQLASEKGASSWLTSLPLEEYGYLLNKQEFHDAIALRYNLTLSDLNRPKVCACGEANTINHCLTCILWLKIVCPKYATITKHSDLKNRVPDSVKYVEFSIIRYNTR